MIKTVDGLIFGAFASEQWYQSSKFYGTGDCFVFTFKDQKYAAYKWSKMNEMFMYSPQSGIRMGSSFVTLQHGDTIFLSAISIDKDFRFGSSKPCSTFHSPQLTNEEDFEIYAAELLYVCLPF